MVSYAKGGRLEQQMGRLERLVDQLIRKVEELEVIVSAYDAKFKRMTEQHDINSRKANSGKG